MKRNRQRIWAVLVMLALVLASCESEPPRIEMRLESDHSQIISEIRGVNATLTEKLAAIEQKMADGFADNAAALAAIKAAVASLEGTTAEKLAAIETAVKAQTTSLETKLALIEATMEAGFADNAAAQGLIQDAIAALEGSATEKLAAIESAVKAQTTSLETKLGLIEKAVETGFADSAAAQGLIKEAIAALEGTTAAKLAAIEAAVKSQASGLDTKLAAIETAVKEGFADSAAAQDLIKKALESLGGTADTRLAAIEKAVKDQTTSFGTKLDLIEQALEKGFADSAKAQGLIEQAIKTLDSNTAGKLAEILQKITGLPNYSGDLDDIKKVIEKLRKMFVLRVELDKTDLTLEMGGTETLTATVFPDDATDKSVTWKTSDPAVAEVSAAGEVTAKKVGTAIITVTTNVGGNAATCEVTVTLPTLNGHEYVDLGLDSGLMWANTNIGASSPEEYGDYFAWGETEPYYSSLNPPEWKTGKTAGYDWASYSHTEGNSDKLTKYCQKASDGYDGYTDTLTTLLAKDDAARVQWGGTWRMPTQEEWGELVATKNDTQNYKWTWCDGSTEQYNNTTAVGWRIERISSPEATLFLPAAEYWIGTNFSGSYVSGFGRYWSSSLAAHDPRYAWALGFASGSSDLGRVYRHCGQSVRPVHGRGFPVTGVEMDKPTLEVDFGGNGKLTATVLPANASNKAVVWTSSNPAVAEVAPDGTVTSKEAGKATITVTTADGGFTATCEVTVKSDFNGHPYVDLGLPSGLKWATMNVGASKAEEYGDYFAWGEIEPKLYYSWSLYKWCNGSAQTLTKYNTSSSYGLNVDNKTTLEKTDDAARAKWGGSWRMPTKEEFVELLNNCTSEWTQEGGVNGRKFTGPNGNSIFLPAAGYREGTSIVETRSSGFYWSSSLYTGDYPYRAWDLLFSSGNAGTSSSGYSRRNGHSVRPVTD